MRLGFSTNSIGDTNPLEAVAILADLGYTSLAITPDRTLLDPFSSGLPAELDRWRAALDRHAMACVIETGARHLLDPLRKHEPTLISPEQAGRERRIEFTRRAIDVAADLGAGCLSLWSGAAQDAADADTLWARLTASLGPILDYADSRDLPLGFEPEPGMFIDTVARFGQLQKRLGEPDGFCLTVDTGHLECLGERPAADVIRPWVDRIVNVHVDDMLPCRHEHLPLGSGEVDFVPLLATLATAGYAGGLHVELPRQSYRWVETARESARFLEALLADRSRPTPAQ
jgi:L-ribulose-5-phosphate 3-epimerase